MSAAAAAADSSTQAGRIQQVLDWTMHHVNDSNSWHLPGGFDVHIPSYTSLHGVMLVIGALFMFWLFGSLYRKTHGAPTGITNLLELFVLFIRDDISIMCMGEEDGRKYAPLFCTFFFFIVILNLMGLIPIFATATGNVSVTMGLATITLGMIFIGGLVKNGPIGLFKAFVPHGVPWPILLMVTPLEIIGVFIKCFALTIRLFANLLAGHIIIFCILGLIYAYGLSALPAFFLVLGIYLMEIFIAFLQAYIFTLLSAMFIGMVYHPAH